MKVSVLSLLVALFWLNTAAAQQFFTPGYAITVQRDTLRGEIRGKGNQTMVFRAGNNAPERTYTPDQIAAYTTETINHVSAQLTGDSITNRIFLRQWTKGYTSLYSFNNVANEVIYVLQLPDQSFMPLRGETAWMMLNSNLSECNDPAFLNLMYSNLFVYNYAYFERIVKAYNRCVKPENEPKPPKQPYFEVGPVLGVARNQWDYNGEPVNLYFNANGLYPAYNTFGAGGFLTIKPRERFSVTVEMLYGAYKGTRDSPVTDPLTNVVLDVRTYSFQEQFLILPVSARYVVLDRATRWYMKAGVNVAYELTLQGQMSSSRLGDSSLQFIKQAGAGYLLGIGVDVPLSGKRHVCLELRMMPHIVKNSGSNTAECRSVQLVVSMPLFTH